MRSNLRGRPGAVVLLVACAALAGGCGNWQRVGEASQPSTEREVTQMFDPRTLYERLGKLVSNGGIDFVGSVAFVPGPVDSTVAIVAISLANRVFAFERSGSGFGARYHIDYEFDRPGAPPIVIQRDNPILVGSFQETMRTDESVVEQQRITLAPGAYQLAVRVRDIGNGQVGSAAQKLTAPAFGAGSFTAPILAYRVHARTSRNDSLSLVMNPRGTVAYGGDTLLIYMEGNGYTRPVDIPLQVRDEHDSVVMRAVSHFAGTGGIEGRVIKLVPDSAPLGQLEILAGPGPLASASPQSDKFVVAAGGDGIKRTNALVSFSSAWVVTNFDDLLSLLRYFGEDRRVEAMRRAKNTDRTQLWQEFYRATDPNPATPENEALDQYFARIAVANQRYREQGYPGWRTDRGEVFIVLGEPDVTHDQSAQLQNNGRYFQWEYTNYRLLLYFQDITGFGHFQLTPQSRSDFDRIRARIQHIAD